MRGLGPARWLSGHLASVLALATVGYLAWHLANLWRLYQWLQQRADDFGFCQTYTEDTARTGYDEERWHWTYVPLSEPLTEEFLSTIEPQDITGFSGAQFVDDLNVIEEYVGGINPACRP